MKTLKKYATPVTSALERHNLLRAEQAQIAYSGKKLISLSSSVKYYPLSKDR